MCKDLYMNVISSFIVITQKRKCPKFQLRTGWINELWHNGILFSIKKKQTMKKCCIMNEFQNDYTEWKKTDNKRVYATWCCLCKTLEYTDWSIVIAEELLPGVGEGVGYKGS